MSFFIQYYILLKNDSLLPILRFPGYFETPLFRTFFHFPWDFEIAGFNCTSAAGRTEIWSWKLTKVQALVVQKVDNVIHRINHYPRDSALGFAYTYPTLGRIGDRTEQRSDTTKRRVEHFFHDLTSDCWVIRYFIVTW